MSIVEKFVTMEYGSAPEDPRETLTWLDAHGHSFGHFIGGKWHKSASAQKFETKNPSTGKVIATVTQGSAEDVDAAVRAARAALPKWQALTNNARSRFLYAVARHLQ